LKKVFSDVWFLFVVNDTGDQLFAGVTDTGKILVGCVVDTGDK
jgi:hypothetical protein